MKLSEKHIERSRILLKSSETFLKFLNEACPTGNPALAKLYYKVHDELRANIHDLYFGRNWNFIRFFDGRPVENPDNEHFKPSSSC